MGCECPHKGIHFLINAHRAFISYARKLSSFFSSSFFGGGGGRRKEGRGSDWGGGELFQQGGHSLEGGARASCFARFCNRIEIGRGRHREQKEGGSIEVSKVISLCDPPNRKGREGQEAALL
ncbi:hypothetical protein KP509_22G077300 [Ceratopteris richardii]|uniref:Uncharacterized protein n=1 Tax=Ceratopteris richardii TaxID=49495 RepID=A0A8T2S9T3_CERRI|nr:hypothetical protein KP509_22G077300 [Ceratopteris richardii]